MSKQQPPLSLSPSSSSDAAAPGPGSRVHQGLAEAELARSMPLMRLPGLDEIGGGWFLSSSTQPAIQAFVVDAYGPHPDIRYTPAAWGGEDGPGEGQALLTLLDQAFVAAMDAVHELLEDAAAHQEEGADFANSRAPWPALAEVSEWGRACGLGHLEGRVFTSADEVLTLLRAMVAERPVLALRRLPLAFAQARSFPEE